MEWRAAIDVLGLDDSWEQAGTIAAEVANGINGYSLAKAGKSLSKDDVREPGDFVTNRIVFEEQTKPHDQSSIDQFEQNATRQFQR